MTELLVKRFVKEHEEIEKMSVRTAYGVLASMVGIFCNVFLFFVKFSIGLLMRSVSVMADGFNNLSDAGASIISFVGVKIASKPADEEHPFGHGRMEYISALIVSFIVIEVGLSFFKDAIGRIRNPLELQFHLIPTLILILSIGVKLWLGLFNKKLGTRIDSKVMLATSADSMGDVIATTATIVSVLVFKIFEINIDGFVGLGVSLAIMWAGVGIAKDTLEPLLGEAVPKDVYKKITTFVEGYEGVCGTHDLIVHNYGPGRSMASLHVEVPNDVDIELSHEIIDQIERDALKQIGIFLVIHMDPVEMKNEATLLAKQQVEQMLADLDAQARIHDFRMVVGENQINLIFDMVVPIQYDKEQRKMLCQEARRRMHEIDGRYQCVIVVENSYVAEE